MEHIAVQGHPRASKERKRFLRVLQFRSYQAFAVKSSLLSNRLENHYSFFVLTPAAMSDITVLGRHHVVM